MTAEWKQVRLDDLTDADSPITYGVIKPGDTGDVLFIRGGDIAGGRVLDNQLRTITSEVSEKYRRTLLRGGELLICLVGQPGQVAVAPPELAGANIARQVGLIRLRDGVDAEFISYFLQSPEGQASLGTYTGGSVQQVINLGDLRTVNVPIPPLPEQRRMVAILDEAFDGAATAQANAEKNLQNARALFESYLDFVFTQPDEEWVDAKLGDVCRKITDGTHITPTYTKIGVPFLSVKNLTKGFIDFSDTRFISVKEHQSLTKRVKPEKGDILYTKVGTTGIARVVDVDEEFSIFVSVALLKTKREIVQNYYLEHFLNSPYARQQARKRTRGMANKNLVIADIKEIDIHFPKSLDEQRSVVGKVDSLATETQRLESVYQQKLATLEALKKSLLHQAFTGAL